MKRKYDVYIIGTGFGCYAKNYKKEYVGSTYAVSAAKAANNVRFNNGGGPSFWTIDDSADQGWVEFSYKAYPAESK